MVLDFHPQPRRATGVCVSQVLEKNPLMSAILVASLTQVNVLCFLQYLESMFTLLFQLLQEVRECDTKMHVLHVLSCVIERVNMQVT